MLFFFHYLYKYNFRFLTLSEYHRLRAGRYTRVVVEGGWPRRRHPPPIFASTHTTKCPTPPRVPAATDKVDMALSPSYLARRRCSFVESVGGRRVCFPWRCFIFVEGQKGKEVRGEPSTLRKKTNEAFTAVGHNRGKERRPKQHYVLGDKMA